MKKPNIIYHKKDDKILNGEIQEIITFQKE